MEDIRNNMLIVLISILILAFLFNILRLVAKKQVEMKNVISWIILSIVALPFVWFPDILTFFAHLIGVQVASNLIFFVAICLLLYLTFSLTRHLSKQSVQIRQLAQKIALKEKSDQDEE